MGVFDTAMSSLIDVMHAADGKTIVLETAQGDVTLTGLFRRQPVDWEAGDGRVSGSGWQIVLKSSAISDYSDRIADMTVTVDGTRYDIVREVRGDAGVSVLELGYV